MTSRLTGIICKPYQLNSEYTRPPITTNVNLRGLLLWSRQWANTWLTRDSLESRDIRQELEVWERYVRLHSMKKHSLFPLKGFERGGVGVRGGVGDSIGVDGVDVRVRGYNSKSGKGTCNSIPRRNILYCRSRALQGGVVG